MEHLLLAGVVGVFVGVLLGVFFMALLAAADRDRFPEPSPVRTHTVSASWPEVPEPSLVLAGIGGSRGAAAVLGITESPHA
jgi:hypothetical protein